MSEWLPIDSAPLERDVLLFGEAIVWAGSMPFEVITPGGWDPDREMWLCLLYNDKGEPIYFSPTHWMPLPECPKGVA